MLLKVVATSDEVERGEELLEESSEGQRLRWIAKRYLLMFQKVYFQDKETEVAE